MPLVATRGAASAQGFGEFAKSAPANYIEDVFSTWLYTGNGSTQTITNGIDLAGKGGMVWIKNRGAAQNHAVWDTVRGAGTSGTNNKAIYTNTSDGESAFNNDWLSAFTSSGFTLGGVGTNPVANGSNANYVSWAFRSQKNFFDVVTYTGTGSARTISHNLGSVPGFILIKRTNASGAWLAYHTSLGNTQAIQFNATAGAITSSDYWNNTSPTSTNFTVGISNLVNASGGTYVAYIFAHNAGGFGLTGTDNVISCGIVDGATTQQVTLGWEPQFVILKDSQYSGNWTMLDTMRGFTAKGGTDSRLRANITDAEDSTSGYVSVNATGFNLENSFPGNTIYIAIRRGPMKTPTSGTSVFTPTTYTGDGTNPRTISLSFSPDLVIDASRVTNNISSGKTYVDRLRGDNQTLVAASTAEENGYWGAGGFIITLTNKSASFNVGGSGSNNSLLPTTYISYALRRAPGFFDVVCYTGTGSATTQTHNLGVVPEMMIVKRRTTAGGQWKVYAASLGNNKSVALDDVGAAATATNWWNATTPTSTVFSVGTSPDTNNSGSTLVAYLFATCPGVSKVGSYTGTGALQTVNCGFTSGARFVLIKRTDSTGDWYMYDSARGISSSNDPYLLMNTVLDEVTNTNYVDADSTGFKVTAAAPAALNANGGSFIYLAIA